MYEYNYCPVCGSKLEEDKIENSLHKLCSNSDCDFVHYLNPKPTVGVIAVRDKKLLLIKRAVDPGKGLWSLPSGFIDPDETAEEACLRELKEETGLTGEISELLGVYSEVADIYGPVMVVMFLVDNLQGEPVANDDAGDVKFVEFKKAGTLNFSSFDRALKKAMDLYIK